MIPKSLHLRSGAAILLYTAVVVGLVQAPAFSMYDPHHGRWFQRDPIGVRPDAPKAVIKPMEQVQDGMNLYEYVGGGPISRTDWSGEQTSRSTVGCCVLEYRSSLVGIATHLGLKVEASCCPTVKRNFNVQFGPELFPLPLGKIKPFPEWTSPNYEATETTTCDKCACLFKLHTRVYRNEPWGYVLTGPNSNSALYDTISDCGLTLPDLKTPRVFFWGLTTNPGPDENGR